MSRLRSGGAQLKDLAVVGGSGNANPAAARRDRPAFEGTIAGICETVISLEEFIGMARWARESDPRAARFLDAWDALTASEQQPSSTDAVCKRIGVAPLDLLKAVADAACRVSMYTVQFMVAVSHPDVVEKTIELALNAEDDSDKLAAQTILHKATGFLPTPKGSQTTIAIMQNAQANARCTSHSGTSATAPPPEQTIRRLSERFNALRGAPLPSAPSATLERVPEERPAREFSPIDAPFGPRRTAELEYAEGDEPEDDSLQ